MSKANIYNRLLAFIGNSYGVCGLMGNIESESNFRSTNMQNSYESRLQMNDATYTQAVDDGKYADFAIDRVGYGLCQWTSSGRKAALLAFAKEKGKSIGDEDMQIDFILYELSVSYKKVLEVLKNAGSVKEASDYVCTKYERPADQSEKALSKRAEKAAKIFAEYAKEGAKDEENVKKKVCIDAGHYGKYNRSPGIPEYYESEIVWKLHLLQKKYLEALGIEVVTTRSNQSKDLALSTRGKKAKGCDLFISNHTNAVSGGMNEKIDHVAVYHLVNDTTTNADDISAEIAKLLAPIIADVMGTKQAHKVVTRKSSEDKNGDGMMNDNYYGVLNGARSVNVPGLILEHSFHTNTRAVKWLLDDANLDRLAKAEAECIAAFLKGKTGADLGADSGETEKDDKTTATAVSLPYLVKITASTLEVKAGAGTSHKTKTSVKKGEVFTIVEESNGWGKLKSGAGWILLKHADKLDATKKEDATESAVSLPYLVRITASVLNVRAGAGIQHNVKTSVKKGEVFTIVEESNGWGKLKSGAGWISLKYTEKC